MSTLLGWTAAKAPFAQDPYRWINMGEIAGSENVHHPGCKIVIHWPTFEAMVLREGEMLGKA